MNLVEIAAKYSLYCFKKMLCSDGEVAESSLLLCKFKEAYVASTCLVLSQLFEGDVWSAGCVSTEDCKSNHLITARSSKYFLLY